MNLERMKGRSVVISGSAFGIGRATASRFAREGASLVLQDIQSGPLLAFRDELRRDGASVEAVVGDVSQAAACEAMIQTAVEAYGRVDVVVANAGIIPLGDVLESTVEDWDKVMAIDGRGMFLTCKYAIEAMLKTGGGSIVCISSISGLAGQSRQSTYGPAKFVATGITKHPPRHPSLQASFFQWMVGTALSNLRIFCRLKRKSVPAARLSCRLGESNHRAQRHNPAGFIHLEDQTQNIALDAILHVFLEIREG